MSEILFDDYGGCRQVMVVFDEDYNGPRFKYGLTYRPRCCTFGVDYVTLNQLGRCTASFNLSPYLIDRLNEGLLGRLREL